MSYSDHNPRPQGQPPARPQARAIAIPADALPQWSYRQTAGFLLVVNGAFWAALGLTLKILF